MFIDALQAELSCHGQPLGHRPAPPVVDPRCVDIFEPTPDDNRCVNRNLFLAGLQ
jgi:hypothetical protein